MMLYLLETQGSISSFNFEKGDFIHQFKSKVLET